MNQNNEINKAFEKFEKKWNKISNPANLQIPIIDYEKLRKLENLVEQLKSEIQNLLEKDSLKLKDHGDEKCVPVKNIDEQIEWTKKKVEREQRKKIEDIIKMLKNTKQDSIPKEMIIGDLKDSLKDDKK